MNRILVTILALILAACQPEPEAVTPETPEAAPESAAPVEQEVNELAAVLDAQPDEVKARYKYRHPQETLEFFGVEPGMTVVEALPGGGWYTKILLPYLGSEGRLIGAAYSLEMYSKFSNATEEVMEGRRAWVAQFIADAEDWAGDNGASVGAFNFGAVPDEYQGSADVVLAVRALHHPVRMQPEGDFLAEVMSDSYAVLKPGGILGIVQHHARDDMSDEFADGNKAYVKKGLIVAAAEQAGFELVGDSNINANELDQPSEEDIVWRLPPSLRTSKDDPELRAKYEAVGESNRMTLKFRKPE